MSGKLILTPPEINLDYHGDVMVFDLDDTLYQERDYMLSGFRAVARRAASPEVTDALVREMEKAYMHGDNSMDALAGILDIPASTRKDVIAEWVEVYRSHIPELTLPDSTASTLQSLCDRGVELALITDGRSHSQRAKIEALGLQRYFAPDNIYISEERGSGKESMEPFAYMVHRYPEASGFTYVADNPAKDFLYPNLMGWYTICLIDRGDNIHPQDLDVAEEYRPQWTIDSIEELLTKDYTDDER